MLPVAQSEAVVSRVTQDDTHVDRLNALWKLSVQHGLSDSERIRAMLNMAAEVLDMDLVVLGEFAEHYTARYVSDRLGVFPEGTVQMVETVLCHSVQLTREPRHIVDLRAHPLYSDHPVVSSWDCGPTPAFRWQSATTPAGCWHFCVGGANPRLTRSTLPTWG